METFLHLDTLIVSIPILLFIIIGIIFSWNYIDNIKFYIYYLFNNIYKKNQNFIISDKDSVNKLEPSKVIKAEFTNNTQQTLKFFDDYLKIKFEFYLLNDIMAYYLTNKDLNPSTINQIKEKFFVDISTSLNEDLYDTLGTIYTKPGLQLYIHQVFISLLNKSSLQYKDTKKIDKRVIDAIIGE